MELPDLPRQNNQREASFALKMRRWIEIHPEQLQSCSIEVKHTRDNELLPFAEVKATQIAYASMISGDKGALIRVQGTNGEPDYVWLRQAPSYIAISYREFFCIVTAASLVAERDERGRKSLSADRAKAIAWKVIHWNKS